MEELQATLVRAREAIDLAVRLLRARVDDQAARIENAELGPHGRSDVVAALHDERDGLYEALERVESAGADIEQAAGILGIGA